MKMDSEEAGLKKTIGKNLQKLRKEAGFKSSDEFANFLNMKPSRYVEYEQGRASFTMLRAWEIADALKCSLDELAGRDFPPELWDKDAMAVLRRYSDLSPTHREAVKDMISVQEAKAGDDNAEAPDGEGRGEDST